MTISRMLYVDDSGAVDHGLIVYGWIEVAPERWRHGLRTILELRKQLYRDHQQRSCTPPSSSTVETASPLRPALTRPSGRRSEGP
jgi:hypothetical protein